MTNFNLLEHPLFRNRKRVLAVPGKAQKPGQTGRKILVNSALVVITLLFFAAGYWMKHPAVISNLMDGFGAGWNNLLASWLGSDTGSVLAEKTPWILARAGGIMSYLAMFAGVALGLTTSLGWIRRASIMYLHRVVSLLAFLFLAVHLGGLAFDSYLQIGLAQSLLPFGVSYRPLWTGLGAVVVYGGLAVGASAYLASKLGYKVWRTIHYASFGLFAMSLLHGLFAGTDSVFPWMQAIYFLTGGAFLVLTSIRVYQSKLFQRQ